MKKLLVITLFLFSSLSYGLFGLFSEPECIDLKRAQERNGILYQVNETQPFSGCVVGFYSNGQKKLERNYKDGKKDGKVTDWYENGQKKLERNYTDGIEDGKVEEIKELKSVEYDDESNN